MNFLTLSNKLWKTASKNTIECVLFDSVAMQVTCTDRRCPSSLYKYSKPKDGLPDLQVSIL